MCLRISWQVDPAQARRSESDNLHIVSVLLFWRVSKQNKVCLRISRRVDPAQVRRSESDNLRIVSVQLFWCVS